MSTEEIRLTAIYSREAIYLDQSGNTAIEYAIIVTLLAAAITSTVHGVGIVLSSKLAGIWWIIDPLPPMP